MDDRLDKLGWTEFNRFVSEIKKEPFHYYRGGYDIKSYTELVNGV